MRTVSEQPRESSDTDHACPYSDYRLKNDEATRAHVGSDQDNERTRSSMAGSGDVYKWDVHSSSLSARAALLRLVAREMPNLTSSFKS